MGSDLIVYTPRPNATPEAELSALVSAYRFILDTAMKEGSRPEPPTPRKDQSHDSRHLKYTR